MTNFRTRSLLAAPLLSTAIATSLSLGLALSASQPTLAQDQSEVTELQTADANDTAPSDANAPQPPEGEGDAAAEHPQPRPEPNARMAGMEELPIGRVGSGDNSGGIDVSYRFYAEAPGLITVAVRAKHGADMTIEVNNAAGQQLPNARCDIDFNGAGNEHLVVLLPAPGYYEVVADPLGSGGDYWISGSYMVIQDLGVLAEPEPPERVTLTHGQTAEANVQGSRSTEAWFDFTAPADGMVIFEAIGTSNGGDLIIESYENDRFDQYTQYVDDDRRGSLTNEMIMADLQAGESIHFKVLARSSSNCTFNARARFVPADLDALLNEQPQPVEREIQEVEATQEEIAE